MSAARKTKFPLPPGVNLLDTEYGAVGRYIDADKVRFHESKPQKMGGWEQWNTPGDELPYVCRSVLFWTDYSYNTWHVFGTAHRLYAFDQTKARSNITPYISTGTLAADPFATTISSADVTVTHASHGVVVGQTVNFSGAAAAGGITVSGDYTVTSVIGVNSYTITHSIAATSTVAAGGGAAVAYSYELAPGNANVTYGRGWGVGLYGAGTWGTARSTNGYASFPRYWCLDNLGQYLVCLASESRLALWQNDPSTRAAIVTGTGIPTTANFMFVTQERMIALLGTDGDFMRLQWCDQDDYTIWTATDLNTAGSRKLQGGSRLIAGTKLSQGSSIIWSDTSCFLMQYTGTNFVYRTPLISPEAGIVGPAAFTVVDGVPYWMGARDFYMYRGGVQTVPNSSDITEAFSSMSEEQRMKTQCHYNPLFREVWWIYPSTSATEPDKYLVYKIDEGHWVNGTMARTAMGSQKLNGAVNMFGVDSTGVIYSHEIGVDADGDALDWHLETGFFDLEEGNVDINIDGYIPDMKRQTGAITITFTSKNYPADVATLDTETKTFAEGEEMADFRHYGRQSKFRLSQTGVIGGDFRLGEQRIEVGTGGRRR